MKRVPRSRRTREEIDRVLQHGIETGEDVRTSLMRQAMRLIVEEALEAKVRDILGRDYYERREGTGVGYRNGYREGRLKSAEGDVGFAVPQLREADVSGLRQLRQALAGRSSALEALAVEMFARGCSTRDIEAAFRGEDGRSLLSRTAVSELTEVLWKEYEEFATRELSGMDPLFLFLDGLAERLRRGWKREAILCAWCITWEGKKVLIHVAAGTKESTECCRDFLEDLRRRGLSDPVLVVTDGAPGLIRAVEECFPVSLRQRCLAHRMRNLAGKLAEEFRAEFLEAARAAYQAPSVAMAQALRQGLVERFGRSCPSAVRCFEEDFEACVAHLRCPPAHRRAIRTTNLLERLFEEERRRLKAVGTVFGERPVLKLMYAALVRASDGWRGVTMTEFARRQLERLKEELVRRHRRDHAPLVRPRTSWGPAHDKEGQ